MRPHSSAWLSGLCLTLLFLFACSGNDKVAGGYDDVENPALTLALHDPQGGASGQSEVKVYARYQNPTLDTVPMLTRMPSAGGVVEIRDSILLTTMRLAQARGVSWPNPDSIEFNIVAKSASAEAYSGNFILTRAGIGSPYRFRQKKDAITILYANAQGNLQVSMTVGPPVLGLKGNIGARGLELGLKSIFIAGSPYWASVDTTGAFTMVRLASGKYEVKAMSVDNKVYSAADTLMADSTGAPYNPSQWSEADLIWIEK